MKTLYRAADPSAQVLGAIVVGFIECSQRQEIWSILERRKLTNVDPDKWYLLQNWLDVLSEIAQDSGAMFNFVSVGTHIGDTAPLLAGNENISFEEMMLQFNENYQRSHRGGVGEIFTEQIAENHVKCTYTTPYPDDLDYGVLYGLARRFLPKGTDFVVQFDDSLPRRDEGGEYSVMHVIW